MQVFDAVNRSVFWVLFGWMLITLTLGGLELVVNVLFFRKSFF